jgi:DNA-directed RNA polymerase subunit H (RpoH/RPB5)
MAKRFIISEEEKSDIRSKYGLVNEQMNQQKAVDVQMRTVKPEMGGKYCFDPVRIMKNIGYNSVLYKVKNGDSLSTIISEHPIADMESIIYHNDKCNLKLNIKSGDVIAIPLIPSM